MDSDRDAAVLIAHTWLRQHGSRFEPPQQLPGTGFGADWVHRMRIATRRSRSVLKSFRGSLPDEPLGRFDVELKWLAERLGRVRDLDVYRDRYAAIRPALPKNTQHALRGFERHLRDEWEEASDLLADALRSARHAAFVADLRAYLESVPAMPPGQRATLAVCEAGEAYVEAATARLLKRGRRIGASSPPEALHDLRKECKRFRYLLEALEPYFDGRLTAARKAAVNLQDVLGGHQDAFAAIERVRGYASLRPVDAGLRGELLALGQLLAVHYRKAVKARKRFDKAWRRLEAAVALDP